MSLEMNKYDYARLVGTRAKMLAEGAKPAVPIVGRWDPIAVAKEEIKLGVCPLVVVEYNSDK